MRKVFKKLKTGRSLHLQILFVLLAFIAMVGLSYIFMGNIVRANLVRNANRMMDVTAAQISSHRQEFEAVLDGFASQAQAMIEQGDGQSALENYVMNVSKSSFSTSIRGFYGYFTTLPGGPVLISDGKHSFSEGFKPQESAWRQQAEAAAGGIIETVPYSAGEGETLYTYAKAMVDEAGRSLGVVCVDVDIAVFEQAVVDTALEQGGYGMLITQDWQMMFHPNSDFVGLSVDDPYIPVSKFAPNMHRGENVSEGSLDSYKGESSVGFFRQLPNRWYLGLVIPENQYYASTTSMALFLCFLGGTLAIILILILFRVEEARAKSDDENKKKSMFLANMSHEIRTPINAIVGMTAIGKTAGSPERKDYCFSKIDDASKHLLGVINDILDMSKIEANKVELSPTDFSVEKMLQQVVNVVNFRVDEKKQKLTVRIDNSVPKVLYADDQRLAQVVTNLLNNAIKFTPEEGTIRLKMTSLGEEDGEYTLQVEVIDTGIGVSPEQQKRLFQSFQQAESSTTRKYGGTGLGLAISKNIVEMMGGKIWVQSALGEGTTIGFTVKVKPGDVSKFELVYQGVNWENIRILTVDDDPDILMYFKEIVSSFGAHCDVAKSAEEALEFVAKNGPYNIYFVDLRMPNVDGIALTKEIRAREEQPGNSVVIMISSADLRTVESEAKQAGVNRFLLKPLFPSAIADVISECIGLANRNNDEESMDIEGIFEGHHILFAEDIDINREIVLTLLQPTGIAIDCAENGREALEMFQKAPGKYDMIFMDVQMPEMDGYEATRQIRALDVPQAQTIPIVAMTANVFKEDIANCLAAGMDGHLGKPLDMSDLLAAALKYLKHDDAPKEEETP